MRIKHIVMIRFLSVQLNTKNILSDDLIDYRLKYVKNNLIPTLNNQTNQDFEVMFLVHPKIQHSQLDRINQIFLQCPLNAKHTIISHNEKMDEYIQSQWEKNDVVILTKTDDDDFIHKNAVQLVYDFVAQREIADIFVCGYKKAYKYNENSNTIGFRTYIPSDGHQGIFQSFMYNTHNVPYKNVLCPYSIPHDQVKKRLNSNGYDCKIIDFDKNSSTPMLIWFRHKNADSFFRKNYPHIFGDTSPNEIQLDLKYKQQLTNTFAINFNGGE